MFFQSDFALSVE